MKNLLRLALVIFRGNGMANFAGDAGRRKKKLSKVASIILFAFLAAYMIAVTTAASMFFYDVLESVNLQSLVVSIFLSAGVVVIFLFGILYVISIFYYASDVEKLLPMPLKADEIIGAKLLVTAMYEYIYEAVLVAPALIVYGIRSGAGVQYFFYTLVTLLILPVVPICMASLISMLIMRFTKFARNKDRFSLVSGLLIMAVALIFVFGTQSMSSLSSGDLSGLLSRSASDIARMTSAAFPGTALAASALADSAGWLAAGRIGLMLLVAAAFLAATMALSRLLYFQGVIGLSDSSSSRRRLTAREMANAGAGGSAFLTYVLKEIRIMVRTPIFFMNNILMNFLWPIFILIPLLGNQQDADFAALMTVLRSALTIDSPSVPLVMAGTFAAACFISATNGIAESAMSREGKMFYLMKILPMSYNTQIWAKLTVGLDRKSVV